MIKSTPISRLRKATVAELTTEGIHEVTVDGHPVAYLVPIAPATDAESRRRLSDLVRFNPLHHLSALIRAVIA